MTENPKITAFRIHRELDYQCRVELEDLTKLLRQHFMGFTSRKDRKFDFTIISANAVAKAYKEAPTDSPIKTKDPATYQKLVKDIMDASRTFNHSQVIYTSESENSKLISTSQNPGNRLLEFNLNTIWAKAEILEGIDALEDITKCRSSIKDSVIVLGTLAPNIDSDEIISVAEDAISQGRVDLSILSFKPGEMMQDLTKDIIATRS